MKMWPESRNSMVEPLEARQMIGRPPKNRRREIVEVRKAGKLARMGTVMTCSICKGANHNKRNCPKYPKPKSTPIPTQKSTLEKRGIDVNMKEQAATRLVQEEVHEVVTRRGQKWLDKQGLSSNRRVNIGVVSSAHVTGDIGFKPTKGLNWKGKQTMTQRELQVQSVMRHIQTRSKAAGIQTRAQVKGKSPSKKTS